MAEPIAKRVRVIVIEQSAEAEVSIGEFSDDELILELERRSLLDSEDVAALQDGKCLSDHYEDKYACGCDEDLQAAGEAIDDVASTRAQAAIRAGDLAEAVLQASRCLPELADLQYLAERRGLITHGA